MSFTYTGDPNNNAIDYGRFMIGDTHDVGHILEDAEIQYLLDINSTAGVVHVTAFRAAIFKQAATMYAIKAAKRSLGPQSEDTTKRLAYFIDEANKAEILARISGVPDVPEYDYDKVFTKNMMANER